MVIGSALVICGILIALHVGRSFEEEAEADVQASEAAKGIAHEEPRGPRLWLVGLPPALLIFYVLAVERLGFVLTAFAMILALGFAFSGRWRVIVPVAVVAPLVVHLVFYKLLRVPLPAGLLPMPW
jgi:putative tricarboxylic transport membrane protein